MLCGLVASHSMTSHVAAASVVHARHYKVVRGHCCVIAGVVELPLQQEFYDNRNK